MLRLHYVAAVFFFFQTQEAFGLIDRILYGSWDGKPGDKFTQGIVLLGIVASVYLFARGFRNIRSIRRGLLVALAMPLFFLVSAGMSIDPTTTLRRAVQYLIVTIGAIGIAGTLKGEKLMELLLLTCGISAAATVALLLVAPGMAEDNGGLHGIFTQKNVLGEAMAIGALASLHHMRSHSRTLGILMLILFTAVTLISWSTTSLINILVFCVLSALIPALAKGGTPRVIAIVMIALLAPIVMLVALRPDTALEMMGKDPTLTGRTELWAYVQADIYQRPLFGWGYGAFWQPSNPAAMEISSALGWFVPQAHNGILELLLNVGVAGTIVLILVWLRNLVFAIRCMRTSERPLAISTLLCLCGIIVTSVSETVMIEPFQVTTAIFFITALMCEKAVRLRGGRPYTLRLRARPSRPTGGRQTVRPGTALSR
jgi:exopolysaccharide production protein ExoQ